MQAFLQFEWILYSSVREGPCLGFVTFKAFKGERAGVSRIGINRTRIKRTLKMLELSLRFRVSENLVR
ncbi:MAG: hypothetical protein ACE5HW_04810 [Candidatus Methanofastidiosia archaeon]